MSHSFRFGLVVSQRDPWDELVRRAQLAEELGVDSIWVVDHFISSASDTAYTFEGWTVLAGLAMVTEKVRLGMLVSGNTYRNPGLLAKQAVTVDHISNGRVEFGIGAGWWEEEHEMYGYDFPPPGERVDMLTEALEMVTNLQEERRTTFRGEHYWLKEAVFEPKPVQQPHMPLVLGGEKPRMLGLVARYADHWNTRAEIEDAAARSAQIDENCRKIGRDPSEIRRSVWPFPDVLESVETFTTTLNAYREAGFSEFISTWPKDDNQAEVLENVCAEVVPAARS